MRTIALLVVFAVGCGHPHAPPPSPPSEPAPAGGASDVDFDPATSDTSSTGATPTVTWYCTSGAGGVQPCGDTLAACEQTADDECESDLAEDCACVRVDAVWCDDDSRYPRCWQDQRNCLVFSGDNADCERHASAP